MCVFSWRRRKAEWVTWCQSISGSRTRFLSFGTPPQRSWNAGGYWRGLTQLDITWKKAFLTATSSLTTNKILVFTHKKSKESFLFFFWEKHTEHLHELAEQPLEKFQDNPNARAESNKIMIRNRFRFGSSFKNGFWFYITLGARSSEFPCLTYVGGREHFRE